MNYIKNSL